MVLEFYFKDCACNYLGWRRKDFPFKSCSYSWWNWSWGENQISWTFKSIIIIIIYLYSSVLLFLSVVFIFLILITFHLIGTSQMVSDRQKKESAPPVTISENGSEKTMYFLAEVCYIFLKLIFPLIIIVMIINFITIMIIIIFHQLFFGASLAGNASLQCWIREGTEFFKGRFCGCAKGLCKTFFIVIFAWLIKFSMFERPCLPNF